MSALRAEQALRRSALEDALRAEAAESERRLCLQFAEEATAFKVQADISLQQAEAGTRAAARREMSTLRKELEGQRGVILLCGPPCAGKSTRGEALGAHLAIPHVALPALLQEAALAAEASQVDASDAMDSLKEAVHQKSSGAILNLMQRAAHSAADGLLLLECPAHSAILPSLLLAIPPKLVLLVDATDRACARRMQRRARSTGQTALAEANLAELLSAYRGTDERVARAFGKRLPGRLCVIDDRVPSEEASAILVEALMQASKAPAWGALQGPVLQGAALPGARLAEPPLLLVGSTRVGSESGAAAAAGGGAGGGDQAAFLAEAMAASWSCAPFHAQAEGSDAAADAAAGLMVRSMLAQTAEGRRCVVSATSVSLPVALRALQRFENSASPAPAPAAAPAAPTTASPASPARAICTAFVLTNTAKPADATQERELERARAALGSAGVHWDSLPMRAGGSETVKSSRGGAKVGTASASSSELEVAMTRVAELLVASSLQLPPLRPLISADERAKQALASRPSVAGAGGTKVPGSTGKLKAASSALDLKLPPSLPPDGLPPTYITGSALRGLVVLAAVQKTGSQLPIEPGESSLLTDTLRAGKLISATSTLRAVQTALHAAPEGLVLVEHGAFDSPLENLVATIRPSLVLLVRPPAVPPTPHSGGGGWSDSLHDVEARQAYELRSLEASFGEDAPQVRLCSSDCADCCDVIYEFLCSDAANERGNGLSDGEVDTELEYEDQLMRMLSKGGEEGAASARALR